MSQSVPSNQINVLMVGENLKMQGGIASLQKLILTHLSHKVNFRHLPTVETSQAGVSIRKLAYFLRAIISLVKILWQSDVDLLHVHVAERGAVFRKVIVIIVACFFQKPLVLHTHGAEFRQFYESLPILMRKVVVWAFKKCDLVIVGSNSWKEFYVKQMGLSFQSVCVNPNPVQIPRQAKTAIHLNHSDKNVKIVFLGRIGARKGTFDLIQAFTKLANELRDDSLLVLAGDGEVNSAKKLIQELDMGNSIEVLGWIDAHQRDELLSSSDIFALPTHNEILPLALLEAMSWALPVVTTPVNGIPEVVTHGQTGLLVEPGNVHQLSDALATLIREKPLRECLGHAAKERVKPLGVEFYCDKLTEIYSSAVRMKV